MLGKFLNTLRDNFTDETRINWLMNTTILGLLSGLLITSKAWSTDRSFPLSPIIPGLEMSALAHDFLFLTVIASLILSLLRFRLKKYFLAAGIISLVLLVVLDITRLQPWIIHYGAILFLLSSLVRTKYASRDKILDAARLIVGGIYFWSGIQKLNLRFFTEIFPWFTESLWQPFGDTGVYLVIFIVLIALFVPFIEALIAIGFFVRRFRSLAITGSILMFITVMIGVGPFGNNWNISVWPWNIAMLGMVFILFSSFKLNFTEFVSRLRKNKLAWIVIFIFWVVPAGNFVGITDNYLSWSLYSGTVPEASILGNQFFLTSLSPLAKDDELLFKHWTTDELNLVPYPENRVFIDIFEQLCNRYNPQPITLIIKSYSVRNIESVRSYECNEY